MLVLRKHLGLDKNLILTKIFSNWLKEYHPKFTFTNEAIQMYDNFVDSREIEKNRNQILTPEQQIEEKKIAYISKIDFEIELIMKKFGINPKYKYLITKAVVCGVVEDMDIPVNEGRFEYDFLLNQSEVRPSIERNFKGSSKSIKKELDRDKKLLYMFRKKRNNGTTYEKSIQELATEEDVDSDEIEQRLKRYSRFLKK
jgi:translation initiation factor 2 beta subunit (eIF-2beta)/eIF-5